MVTLLVNTEKRFVALDVKVEPAAALLAADITIQVTYSKFREDLVPALLLEVYCTSIRQKDSFLPLRSLRNAIILAARSMRCSPADTKARQSVRASHPSRAVQQKAALACGRPDSMRGSTFFSLQHCVMGLWFANCVANSVKPKLIQCYTGFDDDPFSNPATWDSLLLSR